MLQALIPWLIRMGATELVSLGVKALERLVLEAHPDLRSDVQAAMKGAISGLARHVETDPLWRRVELPPGAKDHAPIYTEPVP